MLLNQSTVSATMHVETLQANVYICADGEVRVGAKQHVSSSRGRLR